MKCYINHAKEGSKVLIFVREFKKDSVGTAPYSFLGMANYLIHMHCFWATVKNGHLSLLEHEAAKWVTRHDIDNLNWLPADEGLISEIKNHL